MAIVKQISIKRSLIVLQLKIVGNVIHFLSFFSHSFGIYGPFCQHGQQKACTLIEHTRFMPLPFIQIH